MPRTELLDRLVDTDVPLAVVVAGAGWGKTTLLAQWAERDTRPCDWISLRSDDVGGDELALRVEAIRARTRGRLSHLVVLDGVEGVGGAAELAAVPALVDALPPESTVVVAGRIEPELPLARLRAEGRLLEIGTAELALTRAEAHALLAAAGVELTDAEVAELHRRTEGWATGLYLASLALRAGVAVDEFAGDDRYVADYLRDEHFALLPPADVRFLTRTSVLETVSASACDFVLERRDSARRLAQLERTESFVVPLDHRHELFRYHRLFREFLRHELARREPELVAQLHARAADWCTENGAAAAAVDHAAAAGDVERAARLAARHAVAAYNDGELATIERWLRLLEGSSALDRHPELCIVGSWVHAVRGRTADAERWAEAAESAAAGSPALVLLRALRCRDGAVPMLHDAAAAASGLAAGSPWRPAALLALGVAHLLNADVGSAETALSDAAEAAAACGAADVEIVALAELALVATRREARADADAFSWDARTAAAGHELGANVAHALASAVAARAAARAGNAAAARAELAKAERLRPLLTHAVPWLAVQTLLELTHTWIALAQADDARAALTQAEDILRRRPGLDVLAAEAADLRRRIVALDEPTGRWAASLTAAELRLLPLLATHLSFREIGEQLFVSRNTVKTQAISVYRKFGVSCRSDAIARAVELGFVDGAARSAFTPNGR